MTYDADGLRSTKQINGVRTDFQYVGDKLYYEKRGDNQEFYYFYDSYGNLSMIYYTLVGSNGSTTRAVYHAVTNAQGDVIALHNQNGQLVARYEYDAWGNTLSVTDANGNPITTWYHIANANPIRYRGYYYDSDLGLYYLQSRYYDAEIGRFINEDSLLSQGSVLGNNMFIYCLNNPVNMADTTGQLPFFAITAAVGAVAGAIVGGVKAAKEGKSVLKGALVGAAVGGLIGAGLGAAAGVLFAASATASTASVVIGAKAVAAVAECVGISAAAKMLIDNVSQACSNTPQVFWSGESVKSAANELANNVGGKTLEMTRLGTYLNEINAPYGAWQAASSNFANIANNSSCAIYSVQYAGGVGVQSIWATIEYPLLVGKDITYCVVTQSGTMLFIP